MSEKVYDSLSELLVNIPDNQVICDNIVKAYAYINSPKYEKIMCSISGGADSDVMLDICYKCGRDKKIDYVWFDTGLEYQATKEHLKYLENKYGIKIKSYKAIKPIPTSCKEYGQPFISKQISEWIQRLQKHNFTWEDKPYSELIKKYPKCQAALKWWCNEYPKKTNGSESNFNINYHKYLKEFLMRNPPTFKISNKCCKYAKKDVAHKLLSENKYDLNIVGVRKAEGGSRSTKYKSCFEQSWERIDLYMPLFWYKKGDKEEYKNYFDLKYSDCYEKYGFVRTGCACCPYEGYEELQWEMVAIEEYEPKLYKAVNNIFKDSYEYMRMYEEFRQFMKKKNKDI